MIKKCFIWLFWIGSIGISVGIGWALGTWKSPACDINCDLQTTTKRNRTSNHGDAGWALMVTFETGARKKVRSNASHPEHAHVIKCNLPAAEQWDGWTLAIALKQPSLVTRTVENHLESVLTMARRRTPVIKCDLPAMTRWIETFQSAKIKGALEIIHEQEIVISCKLPAVVEQLKTSRPFDLAFLEDHCDEPWWRNPRFAKWHFDSSGPDDFLEEFKKIVSQAPFHRLLESFGSS